jgi:hypothetical protein
MLTFRPMPGVRSTERRGIGFLEGHAELDAGSEFNTLPENTLRQLRTFVDQWVGGSPDIHTRFHGYRSKPNHKECYVFKPRGKKKQSRFYGFLCHPQKKTRQRFELCVLCINAWKNEKETDDAELNRVVDWLCSTSARMAIAIAFPDGNGGLTQ